MNPAPRRKHRHLFHVIWLSAVLMVLMVSPAVRTDVCAGTGVTVSSMDVQIHLTDEGHARVRQTLSVLFHTEQTELTWMWRIPESSRYEADRVTMTDAASGDTITMMSREEAGSVTSVTYDLVRANDAVRMRLNATVPAGARRVFSIESSARDAVRVFQDAAAFSILFPDLPFRTDRMTVQVDTDLPVPGSSIVAMGTDSIRTETSSSESPMSVRDADVPRGTDITVNCLMPPDAFPHTSAPSDEPARDRMLRAQNSIKETEQRIRSLSAGLSGFSRAAWIGAPVLLTLLWLFHERRRLLPGGRRGTVAEPGDLPPALAGMLMRYRVTGREMAASLYSLAERGCVRLEGRSVHLLWTQDQIAQLDASDRFLLQWVLHRVGDGNSAQLSELAEAAHSGGDPGFHQSFRTYRRLLRTRFQQAGLASRRVVTAEHVLWWTLAALYVTLSVSMALIENWWDAAVLLLPASALVIAGFRTPTLSPYGADQLARLRSFNTSLRRRRDRGMSFPPSLSEWNAYLPYAVALGTEQQFMERTAALYTLSEIRDADLFRCYGMKYESGEDETEALNRFRTQLRDMTSLLRTAALYAQMAS